MKGVVLAGGTGSRLFPLRFSGVMNRGGAAEQWNLNETQPNPFQQGPSIRQSPTIQNTERADDIRHLVLAGCGCGSPAAKRKQRVNMDEIELGDMPC